MLQFALVDDKPLTGEALYDTLYKHYYDKAITERRSIIKELVNNILRVKMNSDGKIGKLTDEQVKILKEYYSGCQDKDIPTEVLKIIKNTENI